MAMKNMIKLSSIIFLAALLLSSLFTNSVFASQANYPLEITNIKPAGTGTPPIPATNRIFRAYPGIEYNIRAAVIGGVYPYQFKLSNAPAGMTVDSLTGEIVWSNPQSDSGAIILSVTDAEGKKVSTNWSITVTTNGFLFVDSSYSGTETGSIVQPYRTIANVVNNTGSVNRTDIIYFREGNYKLPNGSGEYAISNAPHRWIGYPGETVNIYGNYRYIRGQSESVYFDNLNFLDFISYGVRIWGGHHYQTIRRNTFNGLATIDNDSNYGFIFMTSSLPNPQGYGSVIQDNTFTGFKSSQAIGSLYTTNKILIENNHIFEGGQPGITSFCTPIGIKGVNNRYTIRGNKIIMPGDASDFELYNRDSGNDHAEILFNLIVKLPGGNNRSLKIFGGVNDVHFYRNTFIGNIVLSQGSGPNYSNNNIIIGDYVQNYRDPIGTMISNDDLKKSSMVGFLDSNYKLTAEYKEYIGTHGWEVDNSNPPIQTEKLKSPKNLSIRLQNK